MSQLQEIRKKRIKRKYSEQKIRRTAYCKSVLRFEDIVLCQPVLKRSFEIRLNVNKIVQKSIIVELNAVRFVVEQCSSPITLPCS